MMLIPDKGWRQNWIYIIWVVAAVIWMILEGSLYLTIFFGALTAFIIMLAGVRKYVVRRHLSLSRWLVISAVLGLGLGLGSAVFTLILMAVKTGLHAHGPEFTTAEINWVLGQVPVWAVTGLLTGIGFGLLLKALSRP